VIQPKRATKKTANLIERRADGIEAINFETECLIDYNWKWV